MRDKNIRFFFEPGAADPHILDHGVTEEEVYQVLENPYEDWQGREDSRIIIGRTESGRCLQIVSVPDQDGKGIFIVTAYELKGKPLAAFKKRRRRKKK